VQSDVLKDKTLPASAGWDAITEIFDEAIRAGEQPPDTKYPVTKKEWMCGYDAEAPRNSGGSS